MIKVDIISGFLGAGKTTLIKKLIKEAYQGQQLVLIENEFGEIGIDGGFLKSAGTEIKEMNSGCICCSLVGDFGTALKQVIEKYAPDRIIIEPSGVGKLSDVEKAVEKVAADTEIKVNVLTTVVDAKKAKMYVKNFGEFFNNQVEAAKTIILSRTDSIAEDKLAATLELLKEHNDKALIITTPWDQLDGKAIAEAMEKETSFAQDVMNEEVCPKCGHVHHHHDDEDEEECCCHDHDHDHDHDHEHHHDHDHDHDHEHDHDHDHDHDHHHDHDHEDGECCCHDHDHEHHHHHADEVFTSWGTETAKKFDKAVLEEILKKLSSTEEYGIILRSKGIVENAAGGWLEFDLVPEEYELRDSQADVTGKLCVIGTKIEEDKLRQLFGV